MPRFIRLCPVCGSQIDEIDVARLSVANLPDGRRIYAEWDRREMIQQVAVEKFDDFFMLQWSDVAPGATIVADVECSSCDAAGQRFDSFVTRPI